MGVGIQSALRAQRVTAQPSAVLRIVVTVIVVRQPRFLVVHLAAPLDGAGDRTFRRHRAERRVTVARGALTGFSEKGDDVFVLVVDARVDSSVLEKSQRSGRLRLGRVPQQGVNDGSSLEHVQCGCLKVAVVQVMFVFDDGAVLRHFLEVSAAVGVIPAFHDNCPVLAGEGDGAVLRVVGHCPDARAGFHLRLVAVRVVQWGEGHLGSLYLRVLIQSICLVRSSDDALCRRVPVARVIVGVPVDHSFQRGACQFAAVVVGVGIVLRAGAVLPRSGGQSGQRVIAAGEAQLLLHSQPGLHFRHQVALFFIGVTLRHAAGQAHAGEQMRSCHVLPGEGMQRVFPF